LTKRKTREQERRRVYSNGDINRLIDCIFHPIARKNAYVIVDEPFHLMIERDPPESVFKFIRYNGPKLLTAFKEELDRRNKNS
jgi:hypothetical protein